MLTNKFNFNYITKDASIHFSGIGGIGMSGIASLMKEQGYKIQGSDKKNSTKLINMQNSGIKIFQTQTESNISKDTQLLVRSSAISDNNPEIIAAKQLNIPIVSRAEMLQYLTKDKITIAITGAHGKTTTTGLISHILNYAGLSPSFIVGGILENTNSNYNLGSGNYFVVEADESDGSLLRLDPTYSVITNIDYEHMDFYKSVETLEKYFYKFADKTKSQCLISSDDPVLVKLFNNKENICTYGFNKFSDIKITKFLFNKSGSFFSFTINDKTFDNIFSPIFGIHNIKNTVAAICTAIKIGIDIETIKKAVSVFKGVKRRFSNIPNENGYHIIDDYAHHPNEIRAVIQTAKEIFKSANNQSKIIAVIEPHRYTRLKNLFKEFCNISNIADRTYFTPVYEASEKPIDGISSVALVEHMHKNNIEYTESVDKLVKSLIKNNLSKNDIVIFMGAGDATVWAKECAIKL